MSSNTTRYHNNWRFQLELHNTNYVKILTEEELLVTDDNKVATLQRRITDEDNDPQNYVLCEDCHVDR